MTTYYEVMLKIPTLSQASGIDFSACCVKLEILLQRALVLPTEKNLTRKALEH